MCETGTIKGPKRQVVERFYVLFVAEKIGIDPDRFGFPADRAGALPEKFAERKRFAEGVVDAAARLFDAIDDPVSDVADIDIIARSNRRLCRVRRIPGL